MAQDIALDEDFDVFIDDRNDLGTVEGRAEVEQSIALQVSLYFFSTAKEQFCDDLNDDQLAVIR